LFSKDIVVLFVGMGVLTGLGLGQAETAWADGTAPYGEVTRWGGYAVPQLPSKPELGKFVFPVGFAVAPKEVDGEENDVYVLDRVVNEEVFGGESKLGYRLQKLSSTGTPLGSVTLPEEASFGNHNEDARPMVSLAVDPTKGRVYALVEGIVESGGGLHVPVAQRLVAWSTTPNASKELEPASGFPIDSVTHGALVAGPEALEPTEAGGDLYSPQGLVVASNGDVVIEAQQGVSEGVGGPTVLQRVSTTEHSSGEGNLNGAPWNAEAEPGIAPANQQADGLFTANNGSSFGIDLYEKWGAMSRLAEVGSSETGFTQAKLIAPDHSGDVNLDEAPTIDGKFTVNGNGEYNGAGIRRSYTAGSPMTELTNGLYAARYAYRGQFLDAQSEVLPWADAVPFWTEEVSEAGLVGNAGIRLFRYQDEKYEPVMMIGGQPSGECSLDANALSVAAGTNETLFVLTQPNLNQKNGTIEEDNDEVVEFTPGGKGECPKPSGAMTVKEGGVEHQIVNGSVTVHQELPVTFNALSIDRAGETPFEFDWNLEETTKGGTAGTNDGYELGGKIEEPSYLWPTPEVNHIFRTPGEYKASMRLIGDYGTTVFPFTVKVLGTEAPVASFFCSEPIVAGQSATCDASSSTPTGGSTISSYHWEFSDGGKPVTNEPRESHTFASTGNYKVKLVVEDEESQQASAPVEHEVTVTSAPASKCGTTCDPGPSPGPSPAPAPNGPAGPGLTPPPPTHTVAPSVTKPLTTAQKLALALKACKKQPKKHRASCIKQAEKKYATKKKNKTKKKK
jgi:PKD repeat protein